MPEPDSDTLTSDHGHSFVPTKTGLHHYVGPSAPSLLTQTVVKITLELGISLEPPTYLVGAQESPGVFDVSKPDRSLVSPPVIRSLLAHYARCIQPYFDIDLGLQTTDAETNLKRLSEFDRCKVVISCAIAAAHKDYNCHRWKLIAETCRDWADELAVSIIEKRGEQAIIILLLLIVYELADPDRCIVWDLLDTVARICFELGWHKLSVHETQLSMSPNERRESASHIDDANRKLLQVLVSIERYFIATDCRLVPYTD